MLNKQLISKVLGSLLLLEATFMALCVVVALCYHSEDFLPFLFSLIITAVAGMGLLQLGVGAPTTMGRRDAYVVVSLTWITFSIFGSLPYLFGGFFGSVNLLDITSLSTITTNAFFETMSGFTTTGASMLNDVEAELDERPIGGLGIYLVKTIMDTMTYQRTPDGYNVLTLTKQIK